MKIQFLKQNYFNELIYGMRQRGFNLLKQVAISTEEEGIVCYYAQSARDTRLFFRHNKKAIIVSVSLKETQGCQADIKRGWSIIELYAQSLPDAKVDEIKKDRGMKIHVHGLKNLLEEEDRAPFFQKGAFVKGFKNGGVNRFFPNEETKEMPHLEPDILAKNLAEACNEFMPFCAKYFHNLVVTRFVPDLFDPEEEVKKIFWERFGVKETFEGLVKNPIGIDFLESCEY